MLLFPMLPTSILILTIFTPPASPARARRRDWVLMYARAGLAAGWRIASRPRLSGSSLGVAGLTAVVVGVAVADLLRHGRLESVLSAGRAELAAPLLVALVVATGICERIWPAERRPVLARGHVQDVCFLALHAIVVIPLMTLLSVGAAALLSGHARWLELSVPHTGQPG